MEALTLRTTAVLQLASAAIVTCFVTLVAQVSDPMIVARWVGELASHSAACWNGMSNDAATFGRVPEQFVARFPATSRLGPLFFSTVTADEAKSTIIWTICAPVPKSVKAPTELEVRTFPASPALFVVCRDETSRCRARIVEELSSKIDSAGLAAELGTAAARGFRVPRPETGAVDKGAIASSALQTSELLQIAKDPILELDRARILAALKDSGQKRAPLTHRDVAEREMKPTSSDDWLKVMALPLSPELAAKLAGIIGG
jgi:hypothetical protein